MNANLSDLPAWAILVLAAVAVIQVTLDVLALVDLYRRPVAQVQSGNKWAWVAVILLANIIGAVLYLTVGRKRADTGAPVQASTGTSVRAEDVVDSLYDDGQL